MSPGGSRSPWIATTLLVLASIGRVTTAEAAAPTEADAKSLVAMIEGRLAGADTFGAGVVVGASHDMVYIATANHVVRKGTKEVEDLQVRVKSLPGQAIPGILLDDWSSDDDLAVIGIRSTETEPIRVDAIRFDLLGEAGELERREDNVFHIGFPAGVRWHVQVRPDPVSRVSSTELFFESSRVEPGSSGGGLFTEQWRLVGLVQRIGSLEASATRIDRVLELIRNWGYPIDLKRGSGEDPPEREFSPPPTTVVHGEPPRIAYFRSDAMRVGKGKDVTLSWSTENAKEARLEGPSGARDVGLFGSSLERPKKTSIYTLRAWSFDGEEVSQALTVEILDPCANSGGPVTRLRSTSQELGASQLRSIVAQRRFTAHLPNQSGGYDPPVSGSYRGEFRSFEGAVIDCATGLMWQRDTAGPYLPSEAQGYIAQYNNARVGGHSDWRLPTIEELMSLTLAQGRTTSFLNTPLHLDPAFSGNHYYCMSGDRVAYGVPDGGGVWSISWAGPGALGALGQSHRYPVKAVRNID